jgi:hypothetical protein
MGVTQRVRNAVLKSAANPLMAKPLSIRIFELANKHHIEERHIREILVAMADERLISLKAWDQSAFQAVPYDQWSSIDEFFDSTQDGGYKRIEILALGLDAIELDDPRPIGFVQSR